jgi:O-antigen ligase
MTIKKKELSYFLWVFLIVFCIQTTDIKIGFVKISEIILLLIAPFLLLKPINKYLAYFLIFFTVNLVIGLVITTTLDFQVLGRSKIKAPYIISIARYLELITCIVVSLITLKVFKDYPEKKTITTIVNINVYLTIVYVFFFSLVFFRIISQDNSIVVYEALRLRGLYYEGGPFGLMLSLIFILTFFEEQPKRLLLKRFFLILVIMFLAKSKAGIMLSFVWILMYYYESIKDKIKQYRFYIIALFAVIFYFVFVNVGKMYIDETNKIRKSVKERPTDQYLILGRVSGFYIVPTMVQQRPLLGIGIGNYPLLRNNKEIRRFFPIPPREIIDIDSHGLGGIVDILVDMGLIGLILFLIIIYMLYYEISRKKKRGKILILSFLCLYMFGVQLVFLYPWIFIGIILAYKNNYINEFSN